MSVVTWNGKKGAAGPFFVALSPPARQMHRKSDRPTEGVNIILKVYWGVTSSANSQNLC